MFAPPQHQIDSVSDWLKEHDIEATLSANKQWLQFDAAAESVENLLKSAYHVFDHDSGAKNVACDE